MNKSFFSKRSKHESMDEREIHIDVTKRYTMPNKLSFKYLPEGILIIAVDYANWLYLNNQLQKKIFSLLMDFSIEEVLMKMEDSGADMDDLIYVLTELEAKQFELKKHKRIGLDSLNLYLTNICNLRCKHCYMFAGAPMENELLTDEVLALLESFKYCGGSNLILSGGEVTERRDLKEIVTAANKLRLKTTLLTNGTVWSDDLLEYVSDKVAEVQISIDGYDEESNSKIRGAGNFNRAIDTVKRFYDKKVRITVAVTPAFPIDKEKYINYGKWLMDTFSEDNFNLKFSYELIAGRDYISTHVDNLLYRETIEEIVESIYPCNKSEKFALNHKNQYLFSNCGYGTPTIAANGDIYFCNRISDLKCYGNIRDKSFERVSLIAQQISKLSDVDNLTPCKDCDLKYICGGGCRIAYTPSLLNADPDTRVVFQREKCTEEDKMKLYKKMIAANDLFYW